MRKALIIDGFHRGTLLSISHPMPDLYIPVPKQTEICVCDGDEFPYNKIEAHVEKYILAATARDLLLYSISGDLLDAMTNGRDWIVKLGDIKKPTPIYSYCNPFYP